METLGLVDPELNEALQAELRRQETSLSLVAAENLVPCSIMEVQGSVLTNKSVEGIAGERFHGGCEFVDRIEIMAVERAKALFGAEHANVQPHSGAVANVAIYSAVLKLGDKMLSMNLAHGGHLSHGSRACFAGTQLYRAKYYGVDPTTEELNYEEIEKIAREFQPKMIIAGGSAYPKIIDFKVFREIADQVGAYLLVDMSHISGLVAGGVYPSPVPYADFVTSTCSKTLRGGKGAFILCKEKYGKKIDAAVFPGIQGSVIAANMAAKALTFRLASTDEYKGYASSVIQNAKVMAEELSSKGYRLVAGGTETHLMLVDLRNIGMTGREAQIKLEKAGLVVNMNLIPFDPLSHDTTSGIRIGTAPATVRGLRTEEIKKVAHLVDTVLRAPDEKIVQEVGDEVARICSRFPMYVGN